MSDTARKLATIVALDVAGFSARTEADEERTIAQVANLRPVVESIAKSHGGRVFNTAGDGFMLEFASSFSAVGAALELADECRPRVRVGVHVGEVMVQPNGDLLGHGVNVAARLMAKAEPGSAIISADVCRLIRGPLAERFVSRGPVQLDKMNETIEIFAPAAGAAQPTAAPTAKQNPASSAFRWKWPEPRRAAMIGIPALLTIAALVVWGGVNRAQLSPSAPAAPTASIAVLPFENLSADKSDNAFFAAGIQDEILTRLSKVGALKVISRTSTEKYASRPDNLKDIAKTLGVSTILEGSVQRAGDKVRVNVQLIRADTDDHLWAEIYDRKIEDIFAVQSEISTAIVQALNAKLSGAEQQILTSKPTSNVEAYEAFLQASKINQESLRPEDLTACEALLKKAVALDPAFAQAWALLAVVRAKLYYTSRQSVTTPGANPTSIEAEARSSLQMAERLQPDLLEVHYARAYIVYRIDRDFDAARRLFEDLSARWPGNADVQTMLGFIARRQGRWVESINYLSRVAALDPLSKSKRVDLFETLKRARRLADALSTIDEAIALEPGDASLRILRIATLQTMGRLDDAARELESLGSKESLEALTASYEQALLTRNYAPAIAALQAALHQTTSGTGEPRRPLLLHAMLAELSSFAGHLQDAKVHSAYVRDVTAVTLKLQPDNLDGLIGSSFANAWLGNREAALSTVERTIKLWPASTDYMLGMQLEVNRLIIWLHFGERDRAMAELERIMKRDAGELSFSDLRRLPYFDPLRGDPRFDALLRQDPTPP